MRCIKSKLSISKTSIFGCLVCMKTRDEYIRKMDEKALEWGIVGYSEIN